MRKFFLILSVAMSFFCVFVNADQYMLLSGTMRRQDTPINYAVNVGSTPYKIAGQPKGSQIVIQPLDTDVYQCKQSSVNVTGIGIKLAKDVPYVETAHTGDIWLEAKDKTVEIRVEILRTKD